MKHLERARPRTFAAFLTMGAIAGFGGPALSAENFLADAPKIVADFSNAPITLADAISQVAKDGKLATQAKFEPGAGGKLLLSVYTSDKGKAVDAEHNVLAEHVGGFTGDKWEPKSKVFDDVEHVARSAEFHALMTLSPHSLQDIAKRAESEGKVMWVQPVIRDNKPEFDVGVVKGTQVVQVRYDLMTGAKK
jgi:hypothetical protein